MVSSRLYTLICKGCGCEFVHTNNMKAYCTPECKENSKPVGVCAVCGKEFKKYSKRQNTCSSECHHELHKRQMSANGQRKHFEKQGTDGIDFVTCKECGAHLTCFNDKHFAMHGMTREDYERKYGHIRQWMAKRFIDEHFMGSANPNSTANTDDQTRRERSPFSKEFYTSRGMDESLRDEFISSIKRSYTTQLEYYLERGYDMDDAEKMLHRRQVTFSLEKCIERYGKDEGYARWKDRNDRWIASLTSRPDYAEIIARRTMNTGYSNKSQEFFETIHRKLGRAGVEITERYASRGGEYVMRDGSKTYLIDYVIPELKYAIEFNGDRFHVNTDRLTESEVSSWKQLYTNAPASEIIEKDTKKFNFIEDNGYTLRVVWESDYDADPYMVADECVAEILSLYENKDIEVCAD